jgi:hypothetical protein
LLCLAADLSAEPPNDVASRRFFEVPGRKMTRGGESDRQPAKLREEKAPAIVPLADG